jgi:phage tail protein X
LEGSEVTIYVCDGYKADIEISLPEELNETWGTYSVSLWENGTMVHKGDTIDGLARKNYVFKDFVSKSQLQNG